VSFEEAKKNMRRRIAVFIGGIVLLCVFTLFSYCVRHKAFQTVDFAFTVKLQEAIDTSPRLRLSRMVGEVMEGSTFFASPEVSVIAVFTLTIFAFMTLRSIDKSKCGAGMRALVIPCLFIVLVLAEMYGKTVVHHPAPPFFMIKNPTTIFPKYYINEQFSYPSGHASRAVFLTLSIFYFISSIFPLRKKKVVLGFICVGYVLLVSVSRVYLGHHWLSDIIGGWLLGGGCGCITYAFMKRIGD